MQLSALKRRLERSTAPRALGILRITVGITAVLKALEIAPVLARFDDPSTLRIPYIDGAPAIVDIGSVPILVLWIGAAGLFAVGAWTPIAGIVLTMLLAAIVFGDQQLYSNHLYLLLLLVALLTVARAGAAISADARLGRGSERVPGWPLDLIRIQVSIVYAFAALSKVNAVYLSGSVVAVYLRREGPLAIPGDWRSFEFMAVLSLLAILSEAFLAICLWLPRWRRAAFVVGLGMHLSIAIWFDPPIQLWIFGFMVLPTYVLFLNAEPRSRALVWDDSCGFCGTTIRWLARLDWLHVIRLVPSSDASALDALGVTQREADGAIQLVSPGGSRVAGFTAVQRILELLPLSFLWAPLLRLPPIMKLGARIYRAVAARRRCTLAMPREGPRSAETRA